MYRKTPLLVLGVHIFPEANFYFFGSYRNIISFNRKINEDSNCDFFGPNYYTLKKALPGQQEKSLLV